MLFQLSILILPIPTFLLDMALALSFIASILILLVSLSLERPLDFSSLPTLLLLTTILRLSLNVATARLILSHGNEGPYAAGQVVAAFGTFLMGGDVVVGAIIFAMLLMVNFIVITKGSSRIAEVSARFYLDSMPGKQMAIDADLSSGTIDEPTARAAPRRTVRGKRLLRRHGRRQQIRPRRCHLRVDHHPDQHHRRPGHGPASGAHVDRRALVAPSPP